MSAVISPCGNFRYRLDREVCEPYEGSKVFAYFGINPSTADATLDDATVRKWRGFTSRNGGHKFVVGNVFSYRATDPKVLATVRFQLGPEHFTHMDRIMTEADVLVPCWGNTTKVPPHLRAAFGHTLSWLLRSGKPILHFGTTESGAPKHPLMLGYNTPLLPWGKEQGI